MGLGCVRTLWRVVLRLATRRLRLWLSSGDDLDDAHHPFVLVVDGVTVIDEAPDDHGIGKEDVHAAFAAKIGDWLGSKPYPVSPWTNTAIFR